MTDIDVSAATAGTRCVTACVLDDNDVIVRGAAALLHPYSEQICVIDHPGGVPFDRRVDVVLVDCFARTEPAAEVLRLLTACVHVERVAAYSWRASPTQVEAALAAGASGYLSKALSGEQLAVGILALARGEQIVLGATVRPPAIGAWATSTTGVEELTEREAEVLAHLTYGRRTAEIAEAMCLSVNSIKTHTRHLFRKIGVTSRTEAAIWGLDHGLRPDQPPAPGGGSDDRSDRA